MPSPNSRIYSTPSSDYWFNEEGILCSITKKAPPSSLDDTIKILEDFKKMLNGSKVCILIDVTYSSESSKEVRDYAASEFPKLIKAMAMLSESALGRMLANIFFNLKHQPYPVKMFATEKEARLWLKQYL